MGQRKDPHTIRKHHRKPISIGGGSKERNISNLPRSQHEAWHTLFSNLTAQTICAFINEKLLDPDYEFICEKKYNKGT